MINTVIIDDEKDARFLLAMLIQKKFADKINVVGEADDIASGIELIEAKKPDLVFLDIQMKTGTGFDLLSYFTKIDFGIIFVTAYNQFAVRAFKFSAFDYILKPFKIAEIEKSIERFEQDFNEKKNLDRRVQVLIENYGTQGEIHKLILTNTSGFDVLEIANILRLEGDRNYTHFILKGGTTVIASKSLGEYEDMLSAYGFYRIHQSTIISLRHVKSFKKTDDGYVELEDGTIHKVSRNRKQGFISKFTHSANG